MYSLAMKRSPFDWKKKGQNILGHTEIIDWVCRETESIAVWIYTSLADSGCTA